MKNPLQVLFDSWVGRKIKFTATPSFMLEVLEEISDEDYDTLVENLDIVYTIKSAELEAQDGGCTLLIMYLNTTVLSCRYTVDFSCGHKFYDLDFEFTE